MTATDLARQAGQIRDLAALLASLPQLNEPLGIDIRGANVFIRRGGGGDITWADWGAWLVRVAATRNARVEVLASPRAAAEGRYAIDLALSWQWRGLYVQVSDSLHRTAETLTPAEADRRALDAADAFRAAVRDAKAARGRPVAPVANQADLFAEAGR